MVTNLPEDGQPFSKYGHQPSPGCSTTIARRVTNHPKFGHEGSCPSSLGESPTVSRIGLHTIPMKVTHQQYKANHHPQDCYHLSQHSHHHLKDGQLDLEFDSSAAKLVNLVAILAQLVSPSVALPAQLVYVTFIILYFHLYLQYQSN